MTTAYTVSNALPFGVLPTTNGVVQNFKAIVTNSGSATYAPDGLAAAPIYGPGGQPLQGNEIVANGIVTLTSYVGPLLNSGELCWILSDCTGGELEIATATQSQHAATLDQVQSGLSAYAIDAGTANAYVVALSPALTTYVDGVKIRFRALTANTGASTLNVNGLGAVTLVGGAHADLAGGEIIADGYCEAEYNGALAKFVLLECTGAALQVAAAIASQHAVQLGQLQIQAGTAFTAGGSAPAFTLTPSQAITALSTRLRLRVKFNVAGTTGSNTLNISGLGAVALMQYGPDGVLMPAVITAGLLSDVEYNGTYMVVLDPLVSGYSGLQPISASVTSNTLKLGLAPTTLSFRSATANTGTSTPVSIASALSLVVPSGATLGTVAATSARLVLLALYNAGSPVLGVINLAGGISLDESGVISSTAISASATANNVVYTTAAVTSSPYRVVGYIDITEATAGTWATAPTTVQGAGGQAMAAMQSIGFGQTRQAPARSAGVTYYNTTGKPIFVEATCTSSGGGNCGFLINGLGSGITNGSAVATGQGFGVCALVPVGASYSLSLGGTASLTYWTEIR